MVPTNVATTNPEARGDRTDRQVDPAGQHRDRLTPREDGQRHGRAEHAARPGRADTAWAELEEDDEQAEEHQQRDDGPIAEQRPPRGRSQPGISGLGRSDGSAHARLLRC